MMVHSFHINIPSCIYQIEETDGSSAFVACFNKSVDRLYFEHTSEVSVESYNPYNFIVAPTEFLKITFKIDLALYPDLDPYIMAHQISKELKEFIDSIAVEVKHETVPYASTLCSKVASLIEYKLINLGAVMTASETFKGKTGFCRDKANLFMEGYKHMGIPSRFVSGYILGYEEISKCFIRGLNCIYQAAGGWVAFDPTGWELMSGKQVPITFFQNLL